MNCIECVSSVKSNNRVCQDIFNMLDILGIPQQEQAYLWNMACRKIDCRRFRDILSVLIQKL